MKEKRIFEKELKQFVKQLNKHISTDDGEWTIKGFIDVYRNIYTLSSDTKIISKILEIHLFPLILAFSERIGYKIVLAEHQNYYPDLSFIKNTDEKVKFAVDIKTTYRLPGKPDFCNGFTLGSHGAYFIERKCKKNIQYPYSEYNGHFCLGIIYDRAEKQTIKETQKSSISELHSLTSVVSNFTFFATEKWKIASDKGGSGNTANIGSIFLIEDILNENGMFSKLGEKWFDDYWMNFDKITIKDTKKKTKKIRTLLEFVKYKKGDVSKIVKKAGKK